MQLFLLTFGDFVLTFESLEIDCWSFTTDGVESTKVDQKFKSQMTTH